MKEEKLDQLREIFRKELTAMLNKKCPLPNNPTYGQQRDINEKVNSLIYEVKIRI